MTEQGTSAKRVLVVEDEVLIRMLIEDMLIDLGHSIHAIVGEVDEARVVASEAPVDFAILDVHLNGSEVYPVADALAARSIPFVFATGYGSAGIPPRFRERPVLQKPFQQEDLQAALAKAFGRVASA